MQCPICNDTLVASSLSNGCVVHEHQTNCPFVWQDITPGQLHALKDAALGRAVRRFREGMALFKQNPEWAFRQGYSGDIVRRDTLEDVLKAAGLMEVEK